MHGHLYLEYRKSSPDAMKGLWFSINSSDKNYFSSRNKTAKFGIHHHLWNLKFCIVFSAKFWQSTACNALEFIWGSLLSQTLGIILTNNLSNIFLMEPRPWAFNNLVNVKFSRIHRVYCTPNNNSTCTFYTVFIITILLKSFVIINSSHLIRNNSDVMMYIY